MKVDTSTPPVPLNPPVLPVNLLRLKSMLPFEIAGMGQLDCSYDACGYTTSTIHHLPVRKTLGSAGYDLYSVENAIIPANGSATVSSGLSVELPSGHFAKIEGVSALGYNRSIVPFCSVIDEDYHDVIYVKLFNFGNEAYKIVGNTIIAQLVIQKYITPLFKSTNGLNPPCKFGVIGGERGFVGTGY